MSNEVHWLDRYFTQIIVEDDGSEEPPRGRLNLIGFEVVDNAAAGRTEVRAGTELQHTPVSSATPADGQVLGLVDGVWTPADPSTLVPPVPDVTNVAFPGGSGYASASAAFASEDLGTIRIRFVLLTPPTPGAFHWLAGFTLAGAQGWTLCTTDSLGGAPVAQARAYVALDGVLTAVARKFWVPETTGQLVTMHIAKDPGTTKVHVYCFGHEIGESGSSPAGRGVAYTTYNKPSSTALGVGNDSTQSFASEQGIVEVVTSSIAMSAAQVLADAKLPVGAPMAGQTHAYRASSLPASTWPDGNASVSLSRTGTVAVTTNKLQVVQTSRTWRLFGDSILAGYMVSAAYGNGYRKRVQQLLAARGMPINAVGWSYSAAGTFDYDIWHNGTGGERMQTRVATFASDLANCGAVGSGLHLAYGINDLADAVPPNRTWTQLRADLVSACDLHQADSPGAPIVLESPFMPGAPYPLLGPQVTQINNAIAGFDALIVELNAKGYIVEPVRRYDIITDPSLGAGLTWDGLHLTPLGNETLAPFVADAYERAMRRSA